MRWHWSDHCRPAYQEVSEESVASAIVAVAALSSPSLAGKVAVVLVVVVPLKVVVVVVVAVTRNPSRPWMRTIATNHVEIVEENQPLRQSWMQSAQSYH